MRSLMAIVFGCALAIGVNQAASAGATAHAAQPSSEMGSPATEGAQPEDEAGYECKYSPYCQRDSQCDAYCGGGDAVCLQGCCACAS